MSEFVKRLRDHAELIRKMDAIANAERPVQTHEATAALLERAALDLSRADSLLTSIILTLNEAKITDYEGYPLSRTNVLQGLRRTLEMAHS